jgi:hypothetical protein
VELGADLLLGADFGESLLEQRPDLGVAGKGLERVFQLAPVPG